MPRCGRRASPHAVKYWSKIPPSQLRQAINDDALTLGVVAALVMTGSAAALLFSSDDFAEELSEGARWWVHHLYIACNVVSVMAGLACILIGAYTVVHGAKVHDDYFLEFVAHVKGDPVNEAVGYFNVSVIGFVLGVLLGVLLVAGWVAAGIVLLIILAYLSAIVYSTIAVNHASEVLMRKYAEGEPPAVKHTTPTAVS